MKEGIVIIAGERFSGKTVVTLSAVEELAEEMQTPVFVVSERTIFYSEAFVNLSPRMFERTALDTVGVCVIDLKDVKTGVTFAMKAIENGWSVFLTVTASGAVEAMRTFVTSGGDEKTVETLTIVDKECHSKRATYRIRRCIYYPRLDDMLLERLELSCKHTGKSEGKVIPVAFGRKESEV